MITLKNIKKQFGEEILFDNVNLTFEITDKIGIVGKNGVGKSTLLEILKNDDVANSGEVIYANHTVEYLDQQDQLKDFESIIDVINYLKRDVLVLLNKIDEVIHNPNFATDEELIKQYGELDTKLQTINGYELDSVIKKTFSKFNFEKDMYEHKISELSGGQKTRLALAKIIVTNPDYLVLDEPTNHLDINTIEWLENHLKLKSKGVIIVSHDRFFLNRICNKIIEIDNKKVVQYNTNYDNYLIEKETRYNYELMQYENQIIEIKKLNEFIAKFRGKPNKIGQVNDRKSKLARMDILSKPEKDYTKIDFKIEGLHPKKSAYIEIEKASIGYDVPLVNDINLVVSANDKIGIVGDNASGKSTLLKTILQKQQIIDGLIKVHPKIKIGYFDQNFTEINSDKTVYDEIYEIYKNQTQTAIRKYLASFLFFKDDIYKKINNLSGGEKVRLVFAKLAIEKYDLLVLDEPTNHLDLNSKQVLEDVLKNYEGTILLVSHDRYLINKVVNKIGIINNKSLVMFDGNYDNYINFKEQDNIVIKKKKIERKRATKNVSTKKIETKILNLEQQLEEYNNLALQEKYYSDYEKMNELNEKISKTNKELNELYDSI